MRATSWTTFEKVFVSAIALKWSCSVSFDGCVPSRAQEREERERMLLSAAVGVGEGIGSVMTGSDELAQGYTYVFVLSSCTSR